MKPQWGKTTVHRRPDGEVRQSQLITTFGPGALVDLVGDAVVVAGLDFWHFSDKYRAIEEPRLRDDLVERFKRTGRPLNLQHPFREPPIGDAREPSPSCGIEVLEFPRWFVCQNEGCRALVMTGNLERKSDRYWHDCDDGKRSECVPVRFVGACKHGHLDEFPWIKWVHEKAICPAPRLRLQDGATGDFSEVRVFCVCRAQRPLINAVVHEANPMCTGRRPWLGPDSEEPCEEHFRLLTRTASNAYYSQVETALSIPDGGHELRELVQDLWPSLKKIQAVADLVPLLGLLEALEPLCAWTPADVVTVIDQVRSGNQPAREPLRVSEFRQLIAAKAEIPGELPEPEEDFHARRIPTPAIPGLAAVVLVKKLRQVRVQVGFTRVEPATANLQGEFDLEVRAASLSLNKDWLPASEIRGEGIFLQLDEGAVHTWETSPEALARAEALMIGHDRWCDSRKLDLAFPGARYYLLHSLSHLLMSALSLECGYPASSLAERIFCAPHGSDAPMAGLLLMTGSPSAEGTLGGLVEEGRRLERHLRRALALARLCSSDPVCAHHTPKDDLSQRYLEGAACHGCLYVAESSCERFNNYLDRAMVVPTLAPPTCAFFGTWGGEP